MIAGGVDVVRMNFFPRHERRTSGAGGNWCATRPRSLETHGRHHVRPAGTEKSASANSKPGGSRSTRAKRFTLDFGLRNRRPETRSASITRNCRATWLPGAVLLLDDGRLVLDVQKVQGSRITTTVRVGGILSNNKGINRQGGGLTRTGADRQGHGRHQDFRGDEGGFPRGIVFRKAVPTCTWPGELMRAAGGRSMLIAKMERTEAIVAMDEIIESCDGIMVGARRPSRWKSATPLCRRCRSA